MRYPEKYTIILYKKYRTNGFNYVDKLDKNRIFLTRNPNDFRAGVEYYIKRIKDYDDCLELNLERKKEYKKFNLN